jgi:hypothetical protein
VNRIIEAFTRAHDQVTGVDDIIMALVIIPMLLLVVAISYWIAGKLGP